jgi:hypothetical protein
MQHVTHDVESSALSEWFDSIIRTHRRVGLTGGPGIGKSTLVDRMMYPNRVKVIRTDSLANGVRWEDQPTVLWSLLFNQEWCGGQMVVEGVTVARFLHRYPLEAAMFDCLILLTGSPFKRLSSHQRGLTTKVNRYFREWATVDHPGCDHVTVYDITVINA